MLTWLHDALCGDGGEPAGQRGALVVQPQLAGWRHKVPHPAPQPRKQEGRHSALRSGRLTWAASRGAGGACVLLPGVTHPSTCPVLRSSTEVLHTTPCSRGGAGTTTWLVDSWHLRESTRKGVVRQGACWAAGESTSPLQRGHRLAVRRALGSQHGGQHVDGAPGLLQHLVHLGAVIVQRLRAYVHRGPTWTAWSRAPE